jgi:formyl-CoA transferase
VTLDLRQPDGQGLLRVLMSWSRNSAPGTFKKWSLGWDELHALNRRAIMVRVSSYGRHKTGFGLVAEAMSNFRYLSGEPDRPPVRAGNSIGDSLPQRMASLEQCWRSTRGIRPGGTGQGQMVDIGI